jgi:hypothetical protein
MRAQPSPVGIELLATHGWHYTALLLLSVCAAPTVNHLLRAQPPGVTLPAARAADSLLLDTFRRVLDISTAELPTGTWREALIHMRISSGGLGIQSAVDTAERAYLASWAACGASIAKRSPHLAADIAAVFAAPAPAQPAGSAPLSTSPPPTAPFQRVLQDLRSKLSVDLAQDLSNITLTEPVYGEQHALGEHAAKRTRSRLERIISDGAAGRPDEEATMAWWHSTGEFGRGAYLQRYAAWAPMSRRPLAMAVRRHLRLPLPELRDCTRCACGSASDPFGDHGDVCIRLAGLRSWRHNQVRDEGVLAPCKQVGLPAYREEPDLVDGTADRPADVLVIGLELEVQATHSEVCFDVLVVGTTARSYLARGAALRPGAALAVGFSRKLCNVQKLASDRMILVPLVASSTGGFHSAWAHFYDKLAERWQLSGEGRDGAGAKEAVVGRWLAEASTALHRSQYAVIMGLARLCARSDPLTGAEPHSWRPFDFEDVLPFLPEAAH